jgi:formylglycine-generating enzyme required for sulfatase activity
VGAAAAVAIVAGVLLFSGGGGKGPPSVEGKSKSAARLEQRIETPAGAMVLVPSGAFQFGVSRETVDLPAFYVDQTEVSNRAYAEFARATSTALPVGFNADRPDLPVVNVTLAEAQAFADWAGKALPTYKQWEKAARGLDGRTYPWGEAAEASRANVGAGKSGALAPVNGFPNGASPFGALQMVGNAWEWVDETAAPSAESWTIFGKSIEPPPSQGERWVRIRGGSFIEPLDPKVMWDGTTVPTRLRSPGIGFRCVKPVRAE